MDSTLRLVCAGAQDSSVSVSYVRSRSCRGLSGWPLPAAPSIVHRQTMRRGSGEDISTGSLECAPMTEGRGTVLARDVSREGGVGAVEGHLEGGGPWTEGPSVGRGSWGKPVRDLRGRERREAPALSGGGLPSTHHYQGPKRGTNPQDERLDVHGPVMAVSQSAAPGGERAGACHREGAGAGSEAVGGWDGGDLRVGDQGGAREYERGCRGV